MPEPREIEMNPLMFRRLTPGDIKQEQKLQRQLATAVQIIEGLLGNSPINIKARRFVDRINAQQKRQRR